MRITSSFAVFRFQPGEEGLAKARWYSREGQAGEAERAYRAAIAAEPDLRAGWLELFELLRRDGRHDDALHLAIQAEGHFGPDTAMPRAIRGAALAELGRTRDAIAALEEAIELDGNLALAWHELAYAAFRSGEYARALLVLDRAFALEPHTDTLMLRGHILRAAGQYDAAEVAFEGAHQSAEHDVPRTEAEQEIAATRRSAALGGKKPRHFSARERAFADLGAVLLDRAADTAAPLLRDEIPGLFAACLASLAHLVNALGWRPAVCGGVSADDQVLAAAVAGAIGGRSLPIAALDPGDRPLVVAMWNDGGSEWARQLARLEGWKCGYAFALAQAPGVTDSADVIGTLRHPADPAAQRRQLARALEMTPPASAVEPEILALARSPLARWRTRQASSQPTP
jgi:tetratricopeptide (TPR) repeat protein